LGVNDVPEWNGVPLFDVAKILQEEYGLFQAFFDANGQEIADAYAESLNHSLNRMLEGKRVANVFSEANSKTQGLFYDFINSAQVETMGIFGVPTGAALKGIKHRKKNPNTGERRPSFLDTGILRNNFRAWMET
jgi:hypothetical protein